MFAVFCTIPLKLQSCHDEGFSYDYEGMSVLFFTYRKNMYDTRVFAG
jgi:hypothetical protein